MYHYDTITAMQTSEPVVEVDVVAFAIAHQRLRCLLVRRADPLFAGSWALPGVGLGFAERLDVAAQRALAERTSLQLEPAFLEQLYTFDGPDRDPRGRTVSVAYVALLPLDAAVDVSPGRGVDAVAWRAIDDLPRLAFD